MDALAKGGKDDRPICDGFESIGPDPSKDIYVQLVISLALGVSAFLAFCFLRPRWSSLYAARKRNRQSLIAIPELPNTFLGWIPALYRVREEQVLASAGLDGFVFLSFFKMAIRLFAVMFFFAAVVLWPINKLYGRHHAPDRNDTSSALGAYLHDPTAPLSRIIMDDGDHSPDVSFDSNFEYLWSYLIFTWFFSFLAMHFLDMETFKIIKIRQDYLGTQSTITDRTFRLTAIPKDLRTERAIKDFVENLEIGKVKSVTLCRQWVEIDALMADRASVLRKLEEAWAAFLATEESRLGRYPHPSAAEDERGNGNDEAVTEDVDGDVDEHTRFLPAGESLRNVMERRPTLKIRFGFFHMRSRQTDAIDHYEEKLRRMDERIKAARLKEYPPTATAFVTMDSIAACQMAIQALMDPRPGQLMSKPAPAPTDVVWKNTYVAPWKRSLRSWSITVFITILTLVWVLPLATLAGLLSICTIQKVWPSLAEALLRQETLGALVQTALPVLVVSLLNVAVPYLYDYLANQQGLISQGDVELSVISKNFFFTFFNVFLVFATFGAGFKFLSAVQDSWTDARKITLILASSIQDLSQFYLNFIMLQGLGLFPFRLLQVGSVTLYPIYRMGAKTPRDFAELVQPTLFNYGFYLPTALLVYILCMVYSILPGSHLVLFLGLCYFSFGYMVYKYQLVYSMDQPQHATGGAWRIICYRIIVGLVVFQLIMAGYLTLQKAFTPALLVGPLLIITVWYCYHFNRRFAPLTRFIALRSIKRGTGAGGGSIPEEDTDTGEAGQTWQVRRMSTVDEDREKDTKYVNPSLVTPLEQAWIYKDPPPPLSPDASANASTAASVRALVEESRAATPKRQEIPSKAGSDSSSSTFSLGFTHVWRDNSGSNV